MDAVHEVVAKASAGLRSIKRDPQELLEDWFSTLTTLTICV
jgi:hypothetical protein